MPIERQMPQYQSHKKVWALKIKEVALNKDGSAFLVFDKEEFANRLVPTEYITKHNPIAGGYFVQYEKGYLSFSPADAFESGYTAINTCDSD